MPLKMYQSHKLVQAAKIESINAADGGAQLIGRDDEGQFYPIAEVDQSYLDKHDPQPGGYYVVYEDGYESWSPGDVFEKGYTEVEG